MESWGPKEAVALPILEGNLVSCGEGSEAWSGVEGRRGGERDGDGVVCVR